MTDIKLKYNYALLDLRTKGQYQTSNVCFLFKPFYIGRGNLKRWFEHFNEKSNNRKNNIIKVLVSQGFTKHDICLPYFEGSIKETINIEEATVNLLGRFCDGGILSNMTKGGEPGNSSSRSNEWKANHSNIMSGNKNSAFVHFDEVYLVDSFDEIIAVNDDNRLQIIKKLKLESHKFYTSIRSNALYYLKFLIFHNYPSAEDIQSNRELINIFKRDKLIQARKKRSEKILLIKKPRKKINRGYIPSINYFGASVTAVNIIDNQVIHIEEFGEFPVKLFGFNKFNINLCLVNKIRCKNWAFCYTHEFVDVQSLIKTIANFKVITITNIHTGQVVRCNGNYRRIIKEYGIKDTFVLKEGIMINKAGWIRE